MLSINVKYFTKEASLEKAIETIKQSGFGALDYTPDLKNEEEVWTLYCRFERDCGDEWCRKLYC